MMLRRKRLDSSELAAVAATRFTEDHISGVLPIPFGALSLSRVLFERSDIPVLRGIPLFLNPAIGYLVFHFSLYHNKFCWVTHLYHTGSECGLMHSVAPTNSNGLLGRSFRSHTQFATFGTPRCDARQDRALLSR